MTHSAPYNMNMVIECMVSDVRTNEKLGSICLGPKDMIHVRIVFGVPHQQSNGTANINGVTKDYDDIDPHE